MEKDGRQHDKDKWRAQIKLKLPMKVDFETRSDLPGTVNHQIVKRRVQNGLLTTIPFFFRACKDTYAVTRKVKDAKTFAKLSLIKTCCILSVNIRKSLVPR